MAKKVIAFSLSADEIDKAIDELREFKIQLHQKIETLRDRVAQEIASAADSGFGQAVVDILANGSGHNAQVEVSVEPGEENITLVIADGEDAIWCEFGAGVYFNGSPGTSPHPNGVELGMTIGSYGAGHGKQRAWGYYDGNDDLKITRGTPASMPMYNAARTVCDRISEIYREVFG